MEEEETLEKVKKPRSDKQLEAFKKAQEKRKENCELMKQVKEQQAAQVKLEQMKIKEEILKKKVDARLLKVLPQSESETESDTEVVLVKKKKPCGKKKRVVVVETESEASEADDGYIEKPQPQPQQQVAYQAKNKLVFY
jgi:hypothetical protein